ncbi:MAG TPA: hypothetical protein EYG27_01155 [Dehalococcoidia bacterium]|jgi:hypothetical protein|nr:hypothetical protein [Dehalococcoidia bacterium]HIL30130.1 hypothetical protein [Dehalococcoidia bacterium]
MECPKSQWFNVPYSVNHPYPLILSLSKDQLLVKVENGWFDKLTGKANLTGADLRGADLRGADLTSSMRSVAIVAKHPGVAQWLRC